MGCLESLKVASWLLCWGHQVLYDYVASIYIISFWDLILWLYLESDDCWILSSNTYLNDHVLTMDWVPRRVCQRKPIDFVSCIKILASQYTYSSGFLLIYFVLTCCFWLLLCVTYEYFALNSHTLCVPSVNLLSNFNMI